VNIRNKALVLTGDGYLGRVLLRGLETSLPLVGALLVSAQLRLRVIYGTALGEEYAPLPLVVFGLIVFASFFAAVVYDFLPTSSLNISFWRFMVALLVSFGLIVIFLPDLSLLQLLYYVITGLVLGILVLGLPRHPVNLTMALPKIWQHRDLVWIWTSYTVRSRYSQRVLGILWIILLPVITGLIFSFVFQELLRAAPVDVPFLAFFLTALTFWTAFNQGVMNGTTAVEGKMSLINQIYFPREILVIVRMGEILVDFAFALFTLLVINALQGIMPTWLYVYLLPVFFIQLCLTLGIMFFVSYLTIFVRDIPQLVGVILQIAFYLSPILYRVDSIPERFQAIVLINPLVPIIGAYRDIMLYHLPPDLLSLCYPLVMGCTLLYLGYVFFKANESRLADYL